jgi:hypothetical protein
VKSLLEPDHATLVIAKLDRLSRDAHFLLGLQKAGVRFVAADIPEANEMVVGIMAVVAQAERTMISARTKAALAAAKARGVKLGGDRGNLPATAAKGGLASLEARRKAAGQRAQDLAPILAELRAQGVTSLRKVAASLNARGVPAARGGKWTPVQVGRLAALRSGAGSAVAKHEGLASGRCVGVLRPGAGAAHAGRIIFPCNQTLIDHLPLGPIGNKTTNDCPRSDRSIQKAQPETACLFAKSQLRLGSRKSGEASNAEIRFRVPCRDYPSR